MSVSLSVLAQQHAPVEGKADATKSENQVPSSKAIWKKDYQEIKLKMDHFIERVKDAGNDHPDLAREVKTLNQMLSEFKLKIDQFDSATNDERENYSNTMNQYYKRMREAAQKIQDSLDKIKR